MKVFTSNDFTGHWSVPTAAVVVATDKERALEFIRTALKEHGLEFDGTLVELDIERQSVLVLSDGAY